MAPPAQRGHALGGSSEREAGRGRPAVPLGPVGWRDGVGAFRGVAFGLRAPAAAGAEREKQDGDRSERGAPGAGVRRQGRAGLPMRAGVPGPQLGNSAGRGQLRGLRALAFGLGRGAAGGRVLWLLIGVKGPFRCILGEQSGGSRGGRLQ